MNRRYHIKNEEHDVVAIVENWAVVTGRVLGVEDAPALPEFAAVELEVEGVEPFEGYPDLLHVGPGSGLTVLVRQDLVRRHGVETGGRVSIRTRRGGRSRFFAHPDGVGVLD